ncbi:hypothetical protein OG741_16610 [Streptomyces sp. NBC_01410]|uniref:hypothetical protein n=1 Tax=Streptomyces sp. NBC_01410 TaxID=2903856 RepID=UPI00324F98A8
MVALRWVASRANPRLAANTGCPYEPLIAADAEESSPEATRSPVPRGTGHPWAAPRTPAPGILDRTANTNARTEPHGLGRRTR